MTPAHPIEFKRLCRELALEIAAEPILDMLDIDLAVNLEEIAVWNRSEKKAEWASCNFRPSGHN